MASKKASEPIVTNDDVSTEILASAIIDVADAAKKLLSSRLTKPALLVLLKHESGVPMKTIDKVLTSASNLKKYVR